jgi:putative transposase
LDLRKKNKEFQALHSQVTQQVADRFYQARERFFKGLSNKPKKKKPLKYLSLVYPQSGWTLSDTREVGLGKNKKKKARLKQNRLLYPSDTQGVPREPSVSSVRQTPPLWSNPRFLVEEAETLGQSSKESKNAVGVDLGITRLATLSDGRVLQNPKPPERF